MFGLVCGRCEERFGQRLGGYRQFRRRPKPLLHHPRELASQTVTISTGAPRGRALAPTEVLTCGPRSPRTVRNTPDAPSTTLACSLKSAVHLTKPVTLISRSSPASPS